MSNVDKIAKDLAGIIKSSDSKATAPYDTKATVKKVENGTAWVQIPGGVDETPVQMTLSAKAGDTVQVRVSGGRAWITGNGTAPPTDDARANDAYKAADKAYSVAENAIMDAQRAHEAADSAEASAGQAQTSAENAGEYAARALGNLSTVQSVTETLNWITAHGTMTLTTDTSLDPTHVYFVRDNDGDYEVGSYRYSIVTEPELEDISTYYVLSIDESLNNYVGTHLAVTSEGLWLLPDSGGNKVLIATGQGQTYPSAGTYIIGKVNNVDAVLAQFTADGAQIGQTSESHIEIDYHSLQLIARGETKPFFWVSDLRDKNDDYQATITETFTADGGTNTFSVQLSVSAEVSVTDSSHSSNTATRSGQDYTFATTPSEGATVTIVYKTKSIYAKAYTLGRRESGAVGAMSVADGFLTTASGMCSHAEGSNTTASGKYSHAEGHYTTASCQSSHAEGFMTTASGFYSHAEGFSTTASGFGSHAEGFSTAASGDQSHAQNTYTIAAKESQTAIGKYNKEDTETLTSKQKALIIGNGTSENNRSNALAVDWLGEVQLYLDVDSSASKTTAATSGEDKDLFNAIRDLGWFDDVIS